MNLIFREINPEKYNEAYTFNLLHEYSFRDSSSKYISDSEQEREKLTKDLIELLLKGDQKYFCLAAFNQEEMVAAHFLHRYKIDKEPACHVHGLWVHPDFRNKGVGKKLKELGEIWAKKMECKFMDSNVRVQNTKMISLNENLGYEVARLNFRKKLI